MIGQVLTGGTGGFGAFDFDEFSGAHIVEEAVDRNGFGDERVIADAGDVVEDSLFLVADGEPLDVFTGAGAWAFADVLKTLGSESGGFQPVAPPIYPSILLQQTPTPTPALNTSQVS